MNTIPSDVQLAHDETVETATPYVPQMLASRDDMREFRSGFKCYLGREWHEERWKTFRLRFGIYAQRQSGFHMVRAKLPGGRLSFAQARAAAAVNRIWAGSDIHVTTRQGLQFYFVTLENLPGLVETLGEGGITTREASGNTFRSTVACPLAGVCPHEHVDAGQVAERLATAWIRHPLVQHMPRKVKTAVAGCHRDCGGSASDDLAFVATIHEGRHGFRVLAGGGLGARPKKAVPVFNFVTEDDLPAVQEALARLHHRFSDRANKNGSRIKFLVSRFGAEDFARQLRDEFSRVRHLPRRPWAPLDWRTPGTSEAPPAFGESLVPQHDGRSAVSVSLPLGMVDSDRLEALADLAERFGAGEFRLGRDQNLLVIGLDPEKAGNFTTEVEGLGLETGQTFGGQANLVACPGISTCTIGITDSNALARSIHQDPGELADLPPLSIRVSGCHNSCGQHHLADIGLHGLAKKIDGRSAPHYQIHIGGGDGDAASVGVSGPVVPARSAQAALTRIVASWAEEREGGESIASWHRRVGPEHIASLAGSVIEGGEALHQDVAASTMFRPPATSHGECASEAVVAEHLADLAETARLDVIRALEAGNLDQAFRFGQRARLYGGRRLLAVLGLEPDRVDDAAVMQRVRANFGTGGTLIEALDAVEVVERHAVGPEALALLSERLGDWLAVVNRTVDDLLALAPPSRQVPE